LERVRIRPEGRVGRSDTVTTVSIEPPPAAWIAVVADAGAAAALRDCLLGEGIELRQFGARTDLMHCSKSSAPEAIIVGLASIAGGATAHGMDLPWDVPVIAVGPAAPVAAFAVQPQLAPCVAHQWLARPTPADWPLALAFARAAHRRDQAQRQRIDSLQQQAAAQRQVARAKGVLMATQGMTEDEAFARLRSGAMQARMPVSDMARAVVDAALWAQAVNRAGQLRWLSQRCVAAAAQRLARIDPPAARRMQKDAIKRARDTLQALGRMALPDPARASLDQAEAAWRTLATCLDTRLDRSSLEAANAAAELALQRAEVLTEQLQGVGRSPMLRVLNLCARQRMHAQRMVKLGLLSLLELPPADRGEVAALMDRFSQALREVAQFPLRSGELVAAQQQVEDRWRDMQAALQAAEAAEWVRCGEALIAAADELTACWERSLQLLLG